MMAGRYILLLGIIMGLVGCERESETKVTVPEKAYATTGFADYDWLPEKLKHTMDHLARTHTDRHFNFYYYFTVDDINRHFYMIDPGLEVVTEMLVTHEEVLNLIDDKLYDVETRKGGIYVAWDTTNYWRQDRQNVEKSPYYENYIFYVLPKDSADFSQLRVAIVEDTTLQNPDKYFGPPDLTVYTPKEIDTPPHPVRGMEYFRKAIIDEVQSAEVFTLYDTGTVEVAFTVWGHRTHSPNLVRGFSTRSDTHEAYQADGEFIKAINDAKVWWHDARKDGKPVRSKMRMTFDVSTLKNQSP